MAEARSQTVDLMGNSIEYEVSRSSEATKPRIDVSIRGITVIIPEAEEISPIELLQENSAWVVEKKRKYDAYREEIPDRRYEPSETFPYLGTQHEVVVESRSASDVEGGELRLAEHHVEETSVKRGLETLYRRKARETFEDLAEQYASEMGVEYGEIHIRRQRTRFGSCSTSGTLGLNWRLMMAPLEIVEYVAIHELAHLREPNHNDEFWSIVAEYDSDYQDHAEWLNKNSTALIFSEEDI